MFTLDVEAVEAAQATEGANLITSPAQISSILNLNQMNQFAEKYIGKKFEKGTTKANACVALFDAIATKLGIAPETVAKAKEVAAAEKAAKPKKERKAWSKTYIIKVGRKPEEKDGKREVVWGEHADVICDAISNLVAAGKATATREEIMAKAVELGLYEKKKSTQGVNPIFSWWRKSLYTCNWIDVAAKEEAPAKDAAKDAAKA